MSDDSISDARKIADAELYADFAEYVNNGALIDWTYWAEHMPTWTALEASRLINGLDPDVFNGTQPKPNDNDTSAAEREAMRALRLATALGIVSDTPENWFSWAAEHNMRVHDGLLLALRTQTNARFQSSCVIPPPAADNEAALTAGDGAPERSPKVQVHLIKRRVRLLDAEIAHAKSFTIDASNPHLVFAEMAKLAETQFGCLVGIDDDAIKYRNGDVVAFFTFKMLRGRMSRDKAR